MIAKGSPRPVSPTDEPVEDLAVELRNILAHATKAVEDFLLAGKDTADSLVAIDSSFHSGSLQREAAALQASELLDLFDSSIPKFRTAVNRYSGVFRTKKSGGGALTPEEDQRYIDAITGVCNREGAEFRLRHRLAENPDVCVAIFVVDRLPLINGRFGRLAGDKVLFAICQHLAQIIPPDAFMARWSGPAFVAIIDLKNLPREAEARIQRQAGERLQQEISNGDRTVLMPVSCFTHFNRITKGDSPEEIFMRLDEHVARATSR